MMCQPQSSGATVFSLFLRMAMIARSRRLLFLFRSPETRRLEVKRCGLATRGWETQGRWIGVREAGAPIPFQEALRRSGRLSTTGIASRMESGEQAQAETVWLGKGRDGVPIATEGLWKESRNCSVAIGTPYRRTSD